MGGWMNGWMDAIIKTKTKCNAEWHEIRRSMNTRRVTWRLWHAGEVTRVTWRADMTWWGVWISYEILLCISRVVYVNLITDSKIQFFVIICEGCEMNVSIHSYTYKTILASKFKMWIRLRLQIIGDRHRYMAAGAERRHREDESNNPRLLGLDVHELILKIIIQFSYYSHSVLVLEFHINITVYIDHGAHRIYIGYTYNFPC